MRYYIDFLIDAYFPPSYFWFIYWIRIPSIAGGSPAKLENGELQAECQDCQENSSKYDDEDSTDVVDGNAAIASILVLISTDLEDIEFY